MRRPTQLDIAQRADVSRGLVSQVLAGTDRASAEVRDRILAVANELGYRTNYAAAQLSTQKSGVVGLAVPSLGNPIYHELFEGIAEAVDEAELTVFLAVIGHDDPRAARTTDRLLGMVLEGLVIVDPVASDDELRSISAAVPTVVTGSGRAVPGVTSVTIDEEGAARSIVRHLAAEGFRRLIFVTSPWTEAEPNCLPRREAFDTAATEVGLCPEHFICSSELASEIPRLIEDEPECALVAYNDVLGVEVLAAVRSSGVLAKRDVAVVSYDNLPQAANPRNSLTTIDISPHTMGSLAVQVLLGHRKPENGRLISPHELIIRASSVPRTY